MSLTPEDTAAVIDYQDYLRLTAEQVAATLVEAKDFIEAVSAYLGLGDVLGQCLSFLAAPPLPVSGCALPIRRPPPSASWALNAVCCELASAPHPATTLPPPGSSRHDRRRLDVGR